MRLKAMLHDGPRDGGSYSKHCNVFYEYQALIALRGSFTYRCSAHVSKIGLEAWAQLDGQRISNINKSRKHALGKTGPMI